MRILILDDDALSANLLGRLLKSSGYIVTMAYTVAHAEALCDTRQFDLMICDVQLPGEDGGAMTRVAERCKIPIVALTGCDASPASSRRWSQYSAYLRKPVALSGVLQVIDEVMGETA